MATATIIKRYIENAYEIELDETDIFFIRGIIAERDRDKLQALEQLRHE